MILNIRVHLASDFQSGAFLFQKIMVLESVHQQIYNTYTHNIVDGGQSKEGSIPHFFLFIFIQKELSDYG